MKIDEEWHFEFDVGAKYYGFSHQFPKFEICGIYFYFFTLFSLFVLLLNKKTHVSYISWWKRQILWFLPPVCKLPGVSYIWDSFDRSFNDCTFERIDKTWREIYIIQNKYFRIRLWSPDVWKGKKPEVLWNEADYLRKSTHFIPLASVTHKASESALGE